MGHGIRGASQHLSTHSSPLVRHAPAGRWSGPANRAGAARPRQPGHNPDLHAPLRRVAAHGLSFRAPPIGPDRIRPPHRVSDAVGADTPPEPGSPSVGRVLANASLILTIAALAS